MPASVIEIADGVQQKVALARPRQARRDRDHRLDIFLRKQWCAARRSTHKRNEHGRFPISAVGGHAQQTQRAVGFPSCQDSRARSGDR